MAVRYTYRRAASRPRKTYRRSAAKKRTYRKRPTRIYRKPMTKKRILNTTSRKKRDQMTAWTNTSSSGASTTPAQQPLFIAGKPGATDISGIVLWSPTARSLVQFGGSGGTVVQEAMRTATTCYHRGLSEHLRIQTNSPAPWLWRRICFCSKDPIYEQYSPQDTPTTGNFTVVETSNGYKRAAINLTVNNVPNSVNIILDQLFKGKQGIDWTDHMLAHVDTRRVDLRYDKTTRLASGNQSGSFREKKLWHPMNKNLVYNDDETGEAEESSPFSVRDKQGMGNYYIMDLFSSGLGASGSDLLAVQYNASQYWHEK